MAHGRKKSVPVAASTVPQKTPLRPRRTVTLGNHAASDIADRRPSWGFQLIDHDHSGSWTWNVDRDRLVEIASFLTENELKTWKEIWADQTGGNRRRGAKHKFIDVASLCKEAQDRLVDLELDDRDRLFRFRLSGTRRLWGVLNPEDHVFFVLWWDEKHEVCPSSEK